VVHVAYEDLVARPAAVVRSTMQAIGYPCPDWQRKPTRIKKQADATNDAFRARYRALLQRLCMGADRAD
jgi:LPS sulfotransferase NodH